MKRGGFNQTLLKGIYPCYAPSSEYQVDVTFFFRVQMFFQVAEDLKTCYANHSPDSYGSGI
jgi:hypothetical protein